MPIHLFLGQGHHLFFEKEAWKKKIEILDIKRRKKIFYHLKLKEEKSINKEDFLFWD